MRFHQFRGRILACIYLQSCLLLKMFLQSGLPGHFKDFPSEKKVETLVKTETLLPFISLKPAVNVLGWNIGRSRLWPQSFVRFHLSKMLCFEVVKCCDYFHKSLSQLKLQFLGNTLSFLTECLRLEKATFRMTEISLGYLLLSLFFWFIQLLRNKLLVLGLEFCCGRKVQ